VISRTQNTHVGKPPHRLLGNKYHDLEALRNTSRDRRGGLSSKKSFQDGETYLKMSSRGSYGCEAPDVFHYLARELADPAQQDAELEVFREADIKPVSLSRYIGRPRSQRFFEESRGTRPSIEDGVGKKEKQTKRDIPGWSDAQVGFYRADPRNFRSV